MNRYFRGWWLLVPWIGIAAGNDAASPGPIKDPGYVGSVECRACHAEQFAAWQGSHHDLAMQPATADTVLGDFDNARFRYNGVESHFFRDGERFMVRTDGPDGQLRDYAIDYTFGVEPLQQYLIEFPGGRLQTLSIAWDSRPREQDGQRWFHLYPDQQVDHTDPLHWTGREQNWNFQCAECHSTHLLKGYDLESDSYRTTWVEIDVACEACHGPGARHAQQAAAVAEGDSAAWDRDKGLVVDLSDRDGGGWNIDPKTGIPHRTVPRTRHTEIELCARCHARRGQIHGDYEFGKPLGNTHSLSLLEPELYHADGQIKGEVYVYGSFIQSRMYQEGVTCSDCHDPHSMDLRLPGDLVCGLCHNPASYAAPAHHHHAEDSAGASCVACHMPQQYYMVNDERADHSMRIPRPDLNLKLGTPDACSGCHSDQPLQWSVDAAAQWYGEGLARRPHYGEALHAGRSGTAGSANRLLALAADPAQPGIARATALQLLQGGADSMQLFTLQRLLGDSDPLVRAAAVHLLERTEPATRFRLGYPLLQDPVRTVRLEAARTLASMLRHQPPKALRMELESAVQTYIDGQRVGGDRPESHLNIGLVAIARGDAAAAERAYRTALRLDPAFVPGYINLADLYRALEREAEVERTLREGLRAVHDNGRGDLHYALGLSLVRQKRADEALAELRQAAQHSPDQARYAYVYAIALQGAGRAVDGLAVLQNAHNRHANDRDILLGLVTLNQELGNRDAALQHAEQLRSLAPDDPRLLGLPQAAPENASPLMQPAGQ